MFKIEKLNGKFVDNIILILEDNKIFNLELGIKKKKKGCLSHGGLIRTAGACSQKKWTVDPSIQEVMNDEHEKRTLFPQGRQKKAISIYSALSINSF